MTPPPPPPPRLHDKKNNYIKITLKKYTDKSGNTIMIPFDTNNF